MSIIHCAAVTSAQESDIIAFTSSPYTASDLNFSADSEATLIVKTDGGIYKTEGIGAGETQIGTWYTAAADPSEYNITMTQTGGDSLSATWLSTGTYAMSADRTFGMESSTPNELTFNGTLTVTKGAGPTLSSATVTIQARSPV